MKLTIHLHLVQRLRESGAHMPSMCAHGHFLRHSQQDLLLCSRGSSSGNESAFAAVFMAKRTFVSLYRHFLMYAGMPYRQAAIIM